MTTRVLKLARYVIAGRLPGGRRRCVICGRAVHRFMPYMRGWAGAPSLMRALEVVGSDLDAFECPRCGSHDRERHLLLYFRSTGMFEWLSGRHVVHFAPEKHLSRHIIQAAPASYVQCDLYPGSSDVIRMDILATGLETNSVDLLIANHVLEHVEDDLKAINEIFRVLKPGGRAVLQTPYSSKLHRTWQDDGIRDSESRLNAYGQADHVRLYGIDVFGRFVSGGLVSHVEYHHDLLPEVDAKRAGVNVKEPYMLFEKPAVPR